MIIDGACTINLQNLDIPVHNMSVVVTFIPCMCRFPLYGVQSPWLVVQESWRKQLRVIILELKPLNKTYVCLSSIWICAFRASYFHTSLENFRDNQILHEIFSVWVFDEPFPWGRIRHRRWRTLLSLRLSQTTRHTMFTLPRSLVTLCSVPS